MTSKSWEGEAPAEPRPPGSAGASPSRERLKYQLQQYDQWMTRDLAEDLHRLRDVSTPTPIQPGTVYEYTIDLWATGNVFLAGHRIRVEVSSSNFPHWDRNLNTGNPLGVDALPDRVVATQTVLHEQGFASRLVLPTIGC